MKNTFILFLLILFHSCYQPNIQKELYYEAESLYNSGQDDLCIIKLDELLEKYPSNGIALYLRAFAKQRSGNLKGAIEDYSSYISIVPDNEEAYYFRGVVKYQLYDNTALDDYNKAIELNPIYGEAYNNRAIIYLNKKEIEKACIDLKSAQKLGISNADSLIMKYCK
jgi:tetratricopeptide (TPR) repeat protein